MERLEVSEAEKVDLDNQYWGKIKATSPNFGEDSVVPSNVQFKGDINPSREDQGRAIQREPVTTEFTVTVHSHR